MSVVKRRCDRQMADKKGVLKLCDKKCENCVASIEMNGSFSEGHAPIEDNDIKHSKWRDHKLTERNLRAMSGEEV